jgi:hypothetical protein
MFRQQRKEYKPCKLLKAPTDFKLFPKYNYHISEEICPKNLGFDLSPP